MLFFQLKKKPTPTKFFCLLLPLSATLSCCPLYVSLLMHGWGTELEKKVYPETGDSIWLQTSQRSLFDLTLKGQGRKKKPRSSFTQSYVEHILP